MSEATKPTPPAAGTRASPAGEPARPASRRLAWLVRIFPRHVRAFLLGNLTLHVLNILAGTGWWAFWPLALTSLLLAVHYLLYKSAIADEQWAEERIEELNLKSYDRGHIQNILEQRDTYASRHKDR